MGHKIMKKIKDDESDLEKIRHELWHLVEEIRRLTEKTKLPKITKEEYLASICEGISQGIVEAAPDLSYIRHDILAVIAKEIGGWNK